MDWRKYVEEYVIKNKIMVALGVVATIWLAIKISKIILALFLAYLIAAGFAPMSRWMRNKGWKRGVRAGVPVVLILTVLLGALVPMWFIFVNQLVGLINNFPNIVNDLSKRLPEGSGIGQMINNSLGNLGNLSGQVVTITGSVSESFFFIFLVLFICFYYLYDGDRIMDRMLGLWPKNQRKRVEEVMVAVGEKMGRWSRGQVILSASVGVLSWVAYIIAGLPYAEVLALLAALLEFIPYFGPTLALIPALLLALTISLKTVWIVLGAYVIMQILESYFLAPKIVGDAVGLYPLIIAVGVTVGSALYGVAGALLAVPILSMIQVVWEMIGRKGKINKQQ